MMTLNLNTEEMKKNDSNVNRRLIAPTEINHLKLHLNRFFNWKLHLGH